MTSDTCLNVEEVREGDVGKVVILVDRVVGTKEDVLRRRIRDHPLRSPGVMLGGGIEVDRRIGEVGTVLSHQSSLSRSINESGSRSS